jgi:hypothetical protein
MKTLNGAILAILLALTSSTLSVRSLHAQTDDKQPHMETALDHLQQAEFQLQKAQHDKGGHRAKALLLVQRAKAEVQAGMKFDETHEVKGKKKPNSGKPIQ